MKFFDRFKKKKPEVKAEPRPKKAEKTAKDWALIIAHATRAAFAFDQEETYAHKISKTKIKENCCCYRTCRNR